ncbi:hypothetical protein KAR91_83460 [Candidatus Pacearchaeota archaeon]|nr:hypothetical protein [Candidatus Pacearchaeota archaeon]
MQWLIDIVQEWIVAEGYIKTSFVDRGVAGDYDFDKGDLTEDGNWHNLDLSSIVPAGAKAVLIRGVVEDNLIGIEFLLRSHETPSTHNVSAILTQVAFVGMALDMIVHLDSNRIVEYKATNTIWSEIGLTVGGWWL